MKKISQKKNKFATCLAVTAVALLFAGGQVYAQKAPNQPNMNKIVGDSPVQSANQRHRTLHSERKAAAVRLRGLYIHAREQHRDEEIRTHGRHDKKVGGI
jgi:hypothetical protein